MMADKNIGAVVVIERDELVFTVVAEGDAAGMMDLTHDLPAPGGPSLYEQARRAAAQLVETFGLSW